MKKVLIYIPVVLSLVVLGAHFMRYGNSIAVAGALALIALLFVRRAWVARLMQVVLVLGTLEWVYTIYELVVVAVTLASALLFQSKTLKKIYGLDRSE
jgi:hypothetical protein